MEAPAKALIRVLAAALLAASLLAPPPARAVDPRLSWRTLESEHFLVHFPDGGYPMALRTARYLEAAHAGLAPLLGHEPARKTQVVITDDVDTANGSATAIPFPRIRAYMSPPDARSILGEYDDYYWLLLLHEYVHILHLDTVGGLPALGNRIFGHRFGPNYLQPDWVTEGLATHYESRLTGGGRNRSALADMYLRAQVLDDGGLWSLDKVSGVPVDWPGGTLWYLYGGRLWSWLLDTHGGAAARALSHDYGSRTLPYALNLSARGVLGTSFASVYRRWAEAETARHAETLRAVAGAGAVRGRPLTALGRVLRSPRWLGDGEELLAYVDDGRAFPALRRVRLAGPVARRARDLPRVRRVPGGGLFDTDGRFAVYAASEVLEQAQVYDDLWAVDLDGGATVRLTRGLRARDPALSRDGTRLAFVANRRGESAVYLAALHLRPGGAGRPPEAALGTPVRVLHLPGAQFDHPALSPDGRGLAVAVHRPGRGRDLAWIDVSQLTLPPALAPERPTPPRPDVPAPAAAPAPRWITDDPHQDADPAFDPSGRWLYFTSDRHGVYDVHAQRIEDGAPVGALRRITRTPTGAFEPRPSPDGRALAYVDYSSRGYDLALLAPLDPEAAPEAEPARARTPAATWPERAEVWPVRAYSALPTLRPFTWFPMLSSDVEGTVVGATTGGEDVVGRHSWSASGWYGLASHEPGFRVGYTWRGLYPTLSASAGRTVVGASLQRGDQRLGYSDVSWSASVAAGYPLPGTERSQSLALSLGADRRLPRTFVPDPDLTGPAPEPPGRGTSTRLGLSWSASSAHGFAESVGLGEGVRLRLGTTVSTRALGGDFGFVLVTGGITGYLPVPFARGHVLAANAEAGLGSGDFGGRRLFSLGGLAIDDPVLALTRGGTSFGGPVLRGYEPFAFGGEAFGVVNLEYRLPLFEPQWGPGTLPGFLRRVWGAAFVDAGGAGGVPVSLDAGEVKVGVGAELRAELILSYELWFTLRAGLAHGFAEEGRTAPYVGFGGLF